MNWLSIALVVLLSSGILFLLMLRNRIDKRDLVNKLNKDYPKIGDQTQSNETDDLTRNVH